MGSRKDNLWQTKPGVLLKQVWENRKEIIELNTGHIKYHEGGKEENGELRGGYKLLGKSKPEY